MLHTRGKSVIWVEEIAHGILHTLFLLDPARSDITIGRMLIGLGHRGSQFIFELYLSWVVGVTVAIK